MMLTKQRHKVQSMTNKTPKDRFSLERLPFLSLPVSLFQHSQLRTAITNHQFLWNTRIVPYIIDTAFGM